MRRYEGLNPRPCADGARDWVRRTKLYKGTDKVTQANQLTLVSLEGAGGSSLRPTLLAAESAYAPNTELGANLCPEWEAEIAGPRSPYASTLGLPALCHPCAAARRAPFGIMMKAPESRMITSKCSRNHRNIN
jgi:hypothetical protein